MATVLSGSRVAAATAIIGLLLLAASIGQGFQVVGSALGNPSEKHLRNVRQLTFGGENAEAYFSADDRQLIFQAHQGEGNCDQIYTMDTSGANRRLVSTGKGRTTCGYFFPDGKQILYASTHLGNEDCPPRPDYSKGYVWQIHKEYDIFTAEPDGSNLRRLTSTPGYDAEATISRGGRIAFTSVRDGDLDIYVMDSDGKNVKRLTDEAGYDGGPFWSPDGKQIVYRAHHPADPKELEDYRSLLNEGLVRPLLMELFLMDADGSNKRQLTRFGAASFAPYVLPDGKRIIFSSNKDDPRGRNFELYLIGADGTGLERLTFSGDSNEFHFTAFPMFSSDGKRLVFASTRGAQQEGEINIFIADWVE